MRLESSKRPRTAFTLIELMISIALVLLLLAGISRVFTLTGEAVGTNQALSAAVNDARNAQATFGNDISHLVKLPFERSLAAGYTPQAGGPDPLANAPFFVIRSERVAAFRNRQDELSDRDYAAAVTSNDPLTIDNAILTTDIDGNNVEGEVGVPGEIIPRTSTNSRNRRIDLLTFFARDLFHRQTGNDGTFVADQTSKEAWIWYGHLRVKNFAGATPSYKNFSYQEDEAGESDLAAYVPQTSTSVNGANFYTSDWMLGRVCMLMVQPTIQMPGPTWVIQDRFGVNQAYYTRPSPAVVTALAPATLSPLGECYIGTPPAPWPASYGNVYSRATDNGVTFPGPAATFPTNQFIQWARYDLAGADISQYRGYLTTAITNGRLYWMDGPGSLVYRFQTYRYPVRPLASHTVARTTPTLLTGCSSFIVEYAGDFVRQDVDGNVTSAAALRYESPSDPVNVPAVIITRDNGQDGIIDYYVDPKTGTRRIRWYGFPRDVGHFTTTAGADNDTPDGRIDGYNGGRTASEMPDVVPLRDVMAQYETTIPAGDKPAGMVYAGAPFERRLASTLNQLPYADNYADLATGIGIDARYTAAWGPDVPATVPMPKLIRIIMTLEDPTGRLAEGQTFEYIYALP